MKDDKDDKKRELSPPEVTQEKEKKVRIEARRPENPNDDDDRHISVIRAEELRRTAKAVCSSSFLATPVSRKSTSDNLVSRCLNLGINGSPAKIDLDQLHSFFVQLELRVSKQEDEMDILKEEVTKKDEQIFSLRRDNAHLHKEISDIRADSMSMNIPPEMPVDDFLNTVRRELPLASEGLAAAEENISKVTQEIELLTNKVINMEKKIQMNFRRWHLEEEHSLQYSMRDSIKVSGVPYQRDEDTDKLMCRIAFSIGVNINEGDISVSHRTGRMQGNTPRPIIVKFVRRNTKHLILQNKMRGMFY